MTPIATQISSDTAHGPNLPQRRESNPSTCIFSHIRLSPEGNGNTQVPQRAAVHFSDVPYTFSNLRLWDYPWTDTDRKVADGMTTYWTNFAKAFNPNGPGLTNWTAYVPNSEMMLNIGDTMRVEKINTARMDFLAGIVEANRTRH